MAIKSSGTLSLRYDIATEVGNSASNNIRLRTMSNNAGFGSPDAMSEFYGYSTSVNNFYFQTRRGTVGPSERLDSPNSDRIAASGWFRVGSATKKAQLFFSAGIADRSAGTMIRAFYSANLNRIAIHIYDRNGTLRMRRECPLHDNPNRAITGITSSSTGWERDQRGNTDSDGFVHLSFIWDFRTTSYTGLEVLWNGQPLTFSVNNNSTSNSVIEALGWDYRLTNFYFGHGINNVGFGATNNFEGDMDNLWLYSGAATNAELITTIQELYNKGNTYSEEVNGLEPFASQGFEQNLTNQARMDPTKGQWVYYGDTFSIAPY